MALCEEPPFDSIGSGSQRLHSFRFWKPTNPYFGKWTRLFMNHSQSHQSHQRLQLNTSNNVYIVNDAIFWAWTKINLEHLNEHVWSCLEAVVTTELFNRTGKRLLHLWDFLQKLQCILPVFWQKAGQSDSVWMSRGAQFLLNQFTEKKNDSTLRHPNNRIHSNMLGLFYFLVSMAPMASSAV